MRMTIIKDYGIPHNCYDCDLHNYHECDLTRESIEEDYCWNGESREKHCPLREVEAIPKDEYEKRLTTDMATIKQLSNSVKALQKANSEIAGAYDKLKSDYKDRLKADMVANYKDIQADIRRFMYDVNPSSSESDYACNYMIDIIKQKINSLKE